MFAQQSAEGINCQIGAISFSSSIWWTMYFILSGTNFPTDVKSHSSFPRAFRITISATKPLKIPVILPYDVKLVQENLSFSLLRSFDKFLNFVSPFTNHWTTFSQKKFLHVSVINPLTREVENVKGGNYSDYKPKRVKGNIKVD